MNVLPLSGGTAHPKGLFVEQHLIPFCTKEHEPSGIQSYKVSGYGLKGNILIKAPEFLQISKEPATGWTNALNLDKDFKGTIFVKLSAIANGEYKGAIRHSAPGFADIVVNVSGAIGNGTAQFPFPVANADQFNGVRNDLQAAYRQYCHIDLSTYGSGYNGGRGWIAVGTEPKPFAGQYDGQSFNLSGLYIKQSFAQGTRGGLFLFAKAAVFKNITITNAYLSAESCAPLVAENTENTTITNCHVRNTKMDVKGASAGLVRMPGTGTHITLCSAETTSTTKSCGFGGLFNYAEGTIIENCRASVDVVALNLEHSHSPTGAPWYNADSFCGFGVVAASCRISNCYARGKTYGSLWTSGFLQTLDQLVDSPDFCVVTNCYSAVHLSTFVSPPDDPQMGGFAVEAVPGSLIKSCYFDADLAGTTFSAAGEAKSTANAKKKNTYAGWDFRDIWDIDDGKDYPYLRKNT